VLLGWTLLGGLDALNRLLATVQPAGRRHGAATWPAGGFVLISALLDLP
jgi:hypothetical protein